MEFLPNRQGFVTHWLIAGPACAGYAPPAGLPRTWTDQLGFEKALRAVVYGGGAEDGPPQGIRLGRPAPDGEPWRYYYHGGDWFVDAGGFYNSPAGIRLDAAAVLNSGCSRTVRAVLWTYAAVDLWVNGKPVLGAHTPVYKPIRGYQIDLSLRKGANTVYLAVYNLGIRDTRTLFGLQLKNGGGITSGLPDEKSAAPFAELDRWLSSLGCKNGTLSVPSAPPCRAVLEFSGKQVPLSGPGTWKIPEEEGSLTVRGSEGGLDLARHFELIEHLHGGCPSGDAGGSRRKFLERIAAEKWEPRGGDTYFSVFHILARRALNLERPDDGELLRGDLAYVEQCGDCADFLVAGLLRLLRSYKISGALEESVKKALLSFRYWMDEEGSDGMCFWSENHALMFYGDQMIAGSMYPHDVFTRSGRTGLEQSAIGAARCRSWLDDMERRGAEEFNSATYMPVTMTALLNLIDYAPGDISARASAVLDSLMRQLFRHVFQGSVISPQGRVYRDVIYPSRQSIQSVLHMVSAEFPCSDAENIWDVSLFTSRYQFPGDLVETARRDARGSYVSGNARIVLEKTEDYILTSVRCPRAAGDEPAWHNLCFDKNADRSSNAYVKSLNERFHGTSVFEPGVYGYQQHLWYAAVGNECVVFATHPGSSVDLGGMRPGYWYGNGVFPAVRQEGNTLGAVYEIPENHPIGFTHVFWPAVKFDENVREGHWLFGRKGNGCIGLWCSGIPEAVDGVLNACEYRCYGMRSAYYCICGSTRTAGSLSGFASRCMETAPAYDEGAHTLSAKGGYSLTFKPHENKTQSI